MELTTNQLDNQSPIKIDRWLDIDSAELRELDDNFSLTKKWLKMGLESPAFFFADKLGRIWGKGGEVFFPFHFEARGKLIGVRMARKASN